MKRIIVSAFALLLITVAAVAQDNNGRQRQRMHAQEMYGSMADRLAKQMKLEDDKADAFKVLYVDYQTTRSNAANPKGEDEKDEKVNLNKITDEEATVLINRQFAAQEAQLKVDKEYLPRFLEIITPAQAARVYVRRAGGMGGNEQGMRGGQGRPGGFGGPGGGGGFGGPGGF